MYEALSYKRPAGWTHLQRGLGVLLLGPECHAVERVRYLRDAALDECVVLALYSSAARTDISAELARARACAHKHTYTNIQTHMRARTRTRTRTHASTHTHTYTSIARSQPEKASYEPCKKDSY